MIDRITCKELINVLDLLKTIEKLEYFIDHDLGNIQKVTPSMHVINIPSFCLARSNAIHEVH